ncbi:MAG: 4Fe-4S binding protein [Thermoanaerobacteraceae bacterium]|nr:4Fe-4S binding protein [Thermoanaerobacteraceae bacterium]
MVQINNAIRRLDKTAFPAWYEIPLGGTLVSEGSTEYKTGGWRTKRPLWDPEDCTHCLICWIYCPEMAIQVKDGKITGIDATLCKGCGICAQECPREKAMTMAEGGDY